MELKALTEKIETVSKNYARKFHIRRDGNWYVLKLQEEMGELIQSYLIAAGRGRQKNRRLASHKKNFEEEVADVFCHVLLLAKHKRINLEKAIGKKWLKWAK